MAPRCEVDGLVILFKDAWMQENVAAAAPGKTVCGAAVEREPAPRRTKVRS